MKKTGRILLVVIVLLVAGALLYPTIKWYCFVPQGIKSLAAGSNEQIRDYSRGQASRGVRELTSLLASDKDAPVPEEYSYLEKSAASLMKESGKKAPSKWTVYSLLSAFPSQNELFSTIEAYYRDELLEAKKLSNNVLQLGLDLRGGMSVLVEADKEGYEEERGTALSDAELSALIAEDIEILTARIDQFGVTEPDIRQQGSDRILIEVPGETDPERVDSFLRGTGSLTFHLVDSELTSRVNRDYKDYSAAFAADGSIITPSYIPSGRTLYGYYTEDEYGIDTLQQFVVIYDEVALDGSHLDSVRVDRDQRTQRPVVNFHLDSEGGKIFYSFTSANVGKALSVVMDGKVKSVATINSAISQDVQLSGGFTEEEAESIAVTLKTASLPIELQVVSQQSVGATLGDDSVSVALKAIIAGVVLVVIFMVAWYGKTGLIADLALLMNFYMMIAILSALHFTLTLSSIAGLVLTMGMAVDANVIIFERMKDELRAGKSSFEAVGEGFAHAFWTIMDSNVTTIIAAIVLSIFGSSTVKGFANTLAVGIACSLFTSLFVTHLVFDFLYPEDTLRKLRLSWRRRA